MPKLSIDGRNIEVEAGTTILEAARRLGIDIPTMCFLDGHSAETSCMVCVVKVNGRQRLVPSCATKAEDGMVVESGTEEVTSARRTALELLLGDHLGDCVGPCQSGCPAHMDIPTMLRQIAAKRYRDAIITVKRHIALPAMLGRICPEVCEHACRRGQKDGPVSICRLKRFVADVDLASDEPYLPEKQPTTGKRVAVVGAGPAGLAAAYYLQQDGHSCTVFDERSRPGGAVLHEVPVDVLPREVVDSEAALIERLGAQFRLGEKVTSPEGIKGQFDAVLIAVGHTDAAFAKNWGLEATPHGIKVDRATMMTTSPGIFAAGSAITPSKLAVRAVADGRSAAIAISRFLAGRPVKGARNPYSVHIGRLSEGEIDRFMDGASREGRITPPDGFEPEEAVREASRCLHCECGKLRGCKLRDYGIAHEANLTRFRGKRQEYTRVDDNPFVIYESGKCISCGLCVQIAAREGEPIGLTFIGRGFHVRPGVPFDEPFAKALQKAAARCAEACPTGALVLAPEKKETKNNG